MKLPRKGMLLLAALLLLSGCQSVKDNPGDSKTTFAKDALMPLSRTGVFREQSMFFTRTACRKQHVSDMPMSRRNVPSQ